MLYAGLDICYKGTDSLFADDMWVEDILACHFAFSGPTLNADAVFIFRSGISVE